LVEVFAEQAQGHHLAAGLSEPVFDGLMIPTTGLWAVVDPQLLGASSGVWGCTLSSPMNLAALAP
jgi:hypothetical protein